MVLPSVWRVLAPIAATLLLLTAPAAADAAHCAGAGCAAAPTVSVAATADTAQPGQSVTFTAAILDADLPADQHAYEWQLGADAAFQPGQDTLTHAFAVGTWQVTVRVTDLGGHAATASRTIVVANPDPTASFRIDAPAPVTGVVLAFDASGSTQPAPGVTIVRYEWDLNGNGTFETSCSGPAAAARFGTAGTTPVTLRVTDSDGHTSTTVQPVAVTTSPTARVAPGALTPTASGCAGDAGTIAPGGAGSDITCFTTVHTGIAELMAKCFRRTTDTVTIGTGPTAKLFPYEIYTTSGKVRLNGIDVKPAAGVGIRIDTRLRQVRTDGGSRIATASMNSGAALGNVIFHVGTIEWNLPAGKSARFNLGTVSITKGAELFGLDVQGDAKLDLVWRGAELPIWMRLPKPLDVSARVNLRTDNMTGLRLDDVHVKVSNATFGAFEVTDLDLLYSATNARFDGGANLYLSSVGRLVVQVQVTGDSLTMFAANYTPIPALALGSGVFLQHVRFAYEAGPPLSLLGGVRLTAGPPVGGKGAAAIDGSLRYVASDPWMLRADGAASVAGVGLATAYVEYRSNGMFRMSGAASGNFYDIVSARGNIGFWLYTATAQFNAEGSATVCVWKGCGGGGVVISDVGIGGCVYSFVDFGMGYRWGASTRFFLTGCDLGTWRSYWDGDPAARLRSHAKSEAVTSEDLTIGSGERAAFIRVAGASGPPRVKVTGPDGLTITTPAGTENYVKTDRWVILQVPPHNATYVIVARPKAGRWRVETVDGSAGIVAVHAADALPEPRITATVEGRERSRRLMWNVQPAAGQVVRFVERAGDMTQPLGTAHGSSGTIAFRPGDGRAGRRTIVAIVEQDGAPRTMIDVATYTAPGPLVPARPARVTIRRTAMSAVVSWAAAPRATRYRVVVTISDGRRHAVVRRSRSLVLPGIVRRKVVRVQVRGLRADGLPGAATSAVSPAPRRRSS